MKPNRSGWRRVCAVAALSIAASTLTAATAAGPLRIHPDNPRYFTDGTKNPDGSLRAVYLTGSHTWNNLVDMARDDPPAGFDFDDYLDFLELHHHNFIRLWAWDSTLWDTRANGRLGKNFVHHVAPLPWARTGPGLALDGGYLYMNDGMYLDIIDVRTPQSPTMLPPDFNVRVR